MLVNLKQVKSLNMMPSLNKKLDKTRKKWKQEYKGKRSAQGWRVSDEVFSGRLFPMD